MKPGDAKPILFSGDMVRAILHGRKTQTRRVVKPQPIQNQTRGSHLEWGWFGKDWFSGCSVEQLIGRHGLLASGRCPHGAPGDRLWVRETWRLTGNEEWRGITYKADDEDCSFKDAYRQLGLDSLGRLVLSREQWSEWDRLFTSCGCQWRPSTRMPCWASRLGTEITGVRVERVQDISEADAIAEGIELLDKKRLNSMTAKLYLTPRLEFRDLWDCLNAKRGFGWAANPWVWVVEFKVAI